MIGLTSDQSFDLVLARHRHLPAEERPTFRFRFITGRQRIVIEETFEQTDGDTNSQFMRKCFEAIRPHLVGWSNQPGGVPFDPSAFEDVVTWEDLLRIKAQWSMAALEADDQKKSK